jgi:hypothetical protein
MTQDEYKQALDELEALLDMEALGRVNHWQKQRIDELIKAG